MPKYTININGQERVVSAAADTPLLYILRDYLQLNGPKFGCGLGQCGACTILINNVAKTSCSQPISSLGNAAITTLESLANNDGTLHPVQEAFVTEQATQCGYCINGMVMTTVSLLSANASPNEEEIKEALNLNLCRCGTHTRIIKAVKLAAKNLDEQQL